MLLPAAFETNTLRRHPHGAAVTRILTAAVAAVEPGEAVRRFARREGRSLVIGTQAYDLDHIRRLAVLALGKAATGMAHGFVELLDGVEHHGLLIPKHLDGPPPPGFSAIPGGHPVPDANSVRAGDAALELAGSLGAADLLVCLVSGGGSALMTAPVPGVSLDDLAVMTRQLLACGAPVAEINALRRRLDRVKGGGLARAAAPARVASLILSDVVGSPLEVIASGPTVPDPGRRSAALQVLERYGLAGSLPASIVAALAVAPETPKPGDPIFDRVNNLLVGSNELALQAALGQARREGMATLDLGSAWQGEARDVAGELCRRLEAADLPRPFCLAAGGETTVTLRGQGRGGRNQELALAAVESLAGGDGCLLVSLASDGEDGPTGAAGAVADGETLARGLAAGLHPRAYLDDNNAYAYFDALGDLLKPGLTGTNVNDLVFLFGL